MAMVVSVMFLGAQRSVTKKRELRISVSDQACVSEVVEYVRREFPQLPLKDILVTVNEKITSFSQPLNPNDKVTFLPHIGGG